MHSSSSSVFTNYPHLRHGCFCPCPIHQGLRKENGIRSTQLVGSGGMPSSHSATVTALASAIGFQEGFGGPLFATSFVLACIVLNQIVYELPAEHPLAESRPLRELLGHTPLQYIRDSIPYYLIDEPFNRVGHYWLVTRTLYSSNWPYNNLDY
ncbi:hypothetical protein RIF29_41830 [Crotalaria pallida]|uniref:Acid phosphatase/vanadium-dependent haloperoxidase-related protein n=1 Tax=Crotalaria pallida TaxID=3830 RepID=A0AAN9E826_CROPI